MLGRKRMCKNKGKKGYTTPTTYPNDRRINKKKPGKAGGKQNLTMQFH